MKRLILAIALCAPVALLTGCPQATTTTPAPPKQSLDLTIARSLLDAQTAIEKAKGLVATTPALKDPLNRVIASYNGILAAYQIYHAAVASGGTPDVTALTAQLAQLQSGIIELRSAFK